MLTTDRPHPVEENPVVFRVSAVLPAAGAFDAAPIEVPVAGFNRLMLFVTYDRANGFAGAVAIRMESSPYAVDDLVLPNWFRASLYESVAIVPGADAVGLIQREDRNYTATGDAAERFVYGPISLAGAVERLRIAAAESGAVGNPGVCEIIGVLGA